jgi:hypothetical protein
MTLLHQGRRSVASVGTSRRERSDYEGPIRALDGLEGLVARADHKPVRAARGPAAPTRRAQALRERKADSTHRPMLLAAGSLSKRERA